VSEVWKIGVNMKDMRGRSVIERMARNVMDGEGAQKFQRTVSEVVEVAEMVKLSTEKGGTSYVNFQKLTQHIKSLSPRPANETLKTLQKD